MKIYRFYTHEKFQELFAEHAHSSKLDHFTIYIIAQLRNFRDYFTWHTL